MNTWIMLDPSDPRYTRLVHIFESCTTPTLLYISQDNIILLATPDMVGYFLLTDEGVGVGDAPYLGDTYHDALENAKKYRS